MIDLQAIGQVAGGIAAGGLAVFLFIGKIVNQQVTKSFEHSINGNGKDDLGLRSGLKELRTNVDKIADKVTVIEQLQAVMANSLTSRDKLCDRMHESVDRRLQDLEDSRKAHHPAER